MALSTVSFAKMGEPIKMPFGLWSQMGPKKDVLHGGAHRETWQIRLSRPYVAAMQRTD